MLGRKEMANERAKSRPYARNTIFQFYDRRLAYCESLLMFKSYGKQNARVFIAIRKKHAIYLIHFSSHLLPVFFFRLFFPRLVRSSSDRESRRLRPARRDPIFSRGLATSFSSFPSSFDFSTFREAVRPNRAPRARWVAPARICRDKSRPFSFPNHFRKNAKRKRTKKPKKKNGNDEGPKARRTRSPVL